MACNEVGHISTRCPELHSSLNKGFYEGQRIADDDDHDHESIFPHLIYKSIQYHIICLTPLLKQLQEN